MQFRHRLWCWLRRAQLDRDLQEEIRQHLEFKVQELIGAGMAPDQARRQTQVEFGNSVVARERSRQQWGFPRFESVVQDVRYGFRQLRRNAGFTAVAVFTLALGIGANSAIFNVANAFLLKSLPVKDPDELVHIRIGPSGSFEQQAYEELRDRQKTLAGLIAWDDGNITVVIDGKATVDRVDYVSGNFYSLLGVQAIRGRIFTLEDDVPGAPAVAVISYGYWQSRFGLDPSVVGKTVRLKDVACTIVGVAPPGFRGLRTGNIGASITIPAQWHQHLTLKDNTTFNLFGRLAKGMGPQQAQADLDVIYHDWLKSKAETTRDASRQKELLQGGIVVSPARQGSLEFGPRFIVQLRILEAVVGLVLLIACINLANLLLARGTSRAWEIAVRLALGASRGRIIRQLLTENLLLAFSGGALGLILSMYLVRLLLLVLRGHSDPGAVGIELDGTVLGFTAALAIVTGLLFGLVPALRSSRDWHFYPMRGQAMSSAGKPVQPGRVLVVPQVALSLTILILAGLLLRSLQRLQEVDLGFEQHHLLAFWLFPTLSGYEGQRELDLYANVIEAIDGLPGVRLASMSRLALLHRGRRRGLRVDSVGHPDAHYVFNTAAPRWFETLRLPLLVGRDFAAQDGPSSQAVAVINQSMAQKYFTGDDPIGRRIGIGDEEPGVERTIVGVVKDMKFSFRDDMPAEAVYIPYAQAPDDHRGQAWMMVSTTLDPAVMTPVIRDQVHALAKDLPPVEIVSLEQDLQESENGDERSLTRLLGSFGALSLGLALMGLYGTVTYSVSQRVRDLAIRLALGAQRGGLLRMIIGEALRYVLAGVIVGIALALAASHMLGSFLFGVKGFDPMTYVVLMLVLVFAGIAAAYIPARRATSVDPMLALRCE